MTTTTDTAPQEDATRDDAAVAAFEALLTGSADIQTAEKAGDRTPAEADPEGEDEAQAEDEATTQAEDEDDESSEEAEAEDDATDDDDEAEDADPKQTKVTVTIYGKAEELPLDEVVRGHQRQSDCMTATSAYRRKPGSPP